MDTMHVLGRWILTCMLLLAALNSSGCSTWVSSDFTAPDVQLVDAEVVHARLLEQQFKLYFRIDNPNTSSLPMRGINYDIQLNGIPLGKGKANKWLTVPAQDHAYFDIPVQTNIWRHIRTLVRLLEKPDRPIKYELSVEVKTGLLFKKKTLITRSGSIVPGDFLKD